MAYTRTSLQLVTPDRLAHATPCGNWDLRALLHHLSDALTALQEAAELGVVPLEIGCPYDDGSLAIVTTLRTQACSLLGAWANHDGPLLVRVGGSALPVDLLAVTGAVEIAVHGWDVARACGGGGDLPPRLAQELLELAPLLVSDRDRPVRFAAAGKVGPQGSPGDRLLAFLGRTATTLEQDSQASHSRYAGTTQPDPRQWRR